MSAVPQDPPSDLVAHLLEQARAGDASAAGRLLPLVYADLKALAHAKLRSLGPGQTIQPTELVHEVFLKLTKTEVAAWESKRHFISVAALAMRSIVVDRARARRAQKRGGTRSRVDLDESRLGGTDTHTDVLEIDETIKKLQLVDERSAQVVILRFYLGLTEPEIAQALGVTDRTVRRDWQFARAWLHRELSGASLKPVIHNTDPGADR